MKGLFLAVAILTVCSTGVAVADPIMDSVYRPYKAGWFPSVGTPCNQVCRRAGGAMAEFEMMVAPSFPNRVAYVCKTRAISFAVPTRGQVYGTNFDSPNLRPYCMVPSLNGRTVRAKRFKCLCVFRIR